MGSALHRLYDQPHRNPSATICSSFCMGRSSLEHGLHGLPIIFNLLLRLSHTSSKSSSGHFMTGISLITTSIIY
jgi:hypothetical protein